MEICIIGHRSGRGGAVLFFPKWFYGVLGSKLSQERFCNQSLVVNAIFVATNPLPTRFRQRVPERRLPRKRVQIIWAMENAAPTSFGRQKRELLFCIRSYVALHLLTDEFGSATARIK